MNIFHSEFAHNYRHYSFGYTTYAVREEMETRSAMLKAGFLPYTGTPEFKKHSYYLARSLRVHTHPFDLTSENRRILRKFEAHELDWKFIPIEEYSWTKDDTQFCKEYSHERFSKNFDRKRIKRILTHDHCTHICRIQHQEKTIAILLLSCEDQTWHYWFAFFNLTEFTDLPLGKWAMTSFLLKASENRIPHVYLGTCYGKGALYKVRDFNDISYFDGNEWVADKKRLKALCKNEQKTTAIDLIKSDPTYYDNILNMD